MAGRGSSAIGLAIAIVMLALPGGAGAVVGELTQLPAPRACVAEDSTDPGTEGACTDVRGLRNPEAVAVAPDGRHVYVATGASPGGVAAFSRDSTDGHLTQLAGTAGCLTDSGLDGDGNPCADGTGVEFANAIAISPDGANVYVTSPTSDSVAVLDRNSSTGALTQANDNTGCISDGGAPCADGRGLDAPNAVAVSANGANVYVASAGTSDAVAILTRDSATGHLTQANNATGCISENAGECTQGKGLVEPSSVVVAPDGRNVYVGALGTDVGATGVGFIAVFSRNTGTGALSQPNDATGCLSEADTMGACTTVKGIELVLSVAVSPDNAHVYSDASAVAAFQRNATSGALTQLGGLAGCVSDDGSEREGGPTGQCTDGTALFRLSSLALSPGGGNLYAVSQGDGAIGTFSRTASSGGLAQLAGNSGCVSQDGTDGIAGGGTCANGSALVDGVSAAVSQDGENLYSAALSPQVVTVFARETPASTTPPASNQPGPTTPEEGVSEDEEEPTEPTEEEPSGAVAASRASSSEGNLPFTGFPLIGLGVAGSVLMLSGLVLRRATCARRQPATTYGGPDPTYGGVAYTYGPATAQARSAGAPSRSPSRPYE